MFGHPTQVAPERVFFIPVTWKETRAASARSAEESTPWSLPRSGEVAAQAAVAAAQEERDEAVEEAGAAAGAARACSQVRG